MGLERKRAVFRMELRAEKKRVLRGGKLHDFCQIFYNGPAGKMHAFLLKLLRVGVIKLIPVPVSLPHAPALEVRVTTESSIATIRKASLFDLAFPPP